jgi:hypothetical protein
MNPTSKLEAVNVMLSSIGEAPVNSLSSGLLDAELAETILNNTNREIQSKGWHFNTEYNYPLVPNSVTNQIEMPTNILDVDGMTSDDTLDVVQRSGKLYNRMDHSFTFTKTIKVTLKLLLDFEDIPEAARRYITLKAARVFQDRTIGASDLHGIQQRDELEALVDLQEQENGSADYNIFQNYSVSRVIDRRG